MLRAGMNRLGAMLGKKPESAASEESKSAREGSSALPSETSSDAPGASSGKRGRGRPKGAKNKPKQEIESQETLGERRKVGRPAFKPFDQQLLGIFRPTQQITPEASQLQTPPPKPRQSTLSSFFTTDTRKNSSALRAPLSLAATPLKQLLPQDSRQTLSPIEEELQESESQPSVVKRMSRLRVQSSL